MYLPALLLRVCTIFFFNDTATTEIYTLSLHDALPIYRQRPGTREWFRGLHREIIVHHGAGPHQQSLRPLFPIPRHGRMSTPLARKMGVDATQNPGVLLIRRVQDALNGIRPALQMDGGDCELLEVSPDGTAKVLLKGTCTGCPSSSMTVTMGIERRLKASVPEITRVVAV